MTSEGAAFVAVGRVWRQHHGHGPLVVYVHGVMDRSSSFGRITRHLAGVTVQGYDRRGYGHSQDLDPATSLEQQVDDLVDVLDGRRALVFGHSFGGTIALAAAQRRPDLVAGVLAYEFPTPWVDWWPGDSAGSAALGGAGSAEDAAERFMRRMIGDERWAKLPPSTRTARRSEGAAMVADLEQNRPPHPPAFDAAAVGVPVVVAHGTAGAAHHRRSAAEFAGRAPSAELVVVDGAGHGVHLTHPGVIAGLVDQLGAKVPDWDRVSS